MDFLEFYLKWVGIYLWLISASFATANPAESDQTTLMGSESENSCVDSDDQCEGWADSGECITNPQYMLDACRAACGICDPEPDYNSQFSRYVKRATIALSTDGRDLGVPQAMIFEDGTRIQDMYWILAQARNYIDTRVTPYLDESLAEICQNYHQDCAYWSMIGECDTNAKFMHQRCAPVCQTCHELSPETVLPLTF